MLLGRKGGRTVRVCMDLVRKHPGGVWRNGCCLFASAPSSFRGALILVHSVAAEMA
jgi:hypothetical protein